MNITKKHTGKEVIKKINKNLSLVNSCCQEIVKRNQSSFEAMSQRDYIYFVFSADIFYRIKDILFLNKKLKEAKNSFDSSLYVLSRSVLETFIYLKYLLSEEMNIALRFEAFICYSSSNDIKIFNCLKFLSEKNKFIFSEDESSVLSLKMMNEKIAEWKTDIEKHKSNHKNFEIIFKEETERLAKVEQVAKEYDRIMNIKSIKEGEENKSLEWMYNYLYRFQSMSAHQNLRDKEKVFKLYLEKKEEPDNSAVLYLIEDISEQISDLYNL